MLFCELLGTFQAPVGGPQDVGGLVQEFCQELSEVKGNLIQFPEPFLLPLPSQVLLWEVMAMEHLVQ